MEANNWFSEKHSVRLLSGLKPDIVVGNAHERNTDLMNFL